MAGTTVSHHAYVGDSVLGADVNFGEGTKVANLRHDEDTVHVQVKGKLVDTGRRKFGVVVGDDEDRHQYELERWRDARHGDANVAW